MSLPMQSKWVTQVAKHLGELEPDLPRTQAKLIAMALLMHGERGDPKVAAERFLDGDRDYLDGGQSITRATERLESELRVAAAKLYADDWCSAFVPVFSGESNLFLFVGTPQEFLEVNRSAEGLLTAMQRGKEASATCWALVEPVLAAVAATPISVYMMGPVAPGGGDQEQHLMLGDLAYFERCVEQLSGGGTRRGR